MTKIRFALFDNDGYMESFTGYLCKKYRNIVEARLFTDFKLLERQLELGRIDVLLASEELAARLRMYSDKVPQMVFLSEGNTRKEKTEFPVIFKYQAVSEIVTEIFELMAENDRISYHTEIVSKRTVEIICGYAPFGGGGVTEFLFQKAEEEAAKKRKVLYINLEEFHGFSHLQREQRGGMSEVLFYLRQRRGKLALKLESVIHRKGNLDCIFSVGDYRDLHSVTGEDMMEFLRVLYEQTEYEMLLFDIGFLNEAGLLLMEHCGKIYMPKPKSRTQISKDEAFEKNLMASGQENLLEKREWILQREDVDSVNKKRS